MAFELLKRLFGTGKDSTERRRHTRVNARLGTRVLVIDDSTTIVAVLGKMLRQSGYQVISAGDAETGIEIATREKPDLIFLDIVLPGMNGFAALRVLRRDPATMRTPVIMISGNMQATEQFYAQRIGADDFMKKPFGRDEVFTRVQRLIESGRLVPRSDDEAPITPPPDEPADIPDIAMPDPSDLAAGAGAGTTAPTVTERPDV
jgi:twitching motility two-component system response regulator PilH